MKRASTNDKDVAARVKFFQYRVPKEFYDFEKDPDALQNLIDDLGYSDEVQKMRKGLLDFMTSIEDPLV